MVLNRKAPEPFGCITASNGVAIFASQKALLAVNTFLLLKTDSNPGHSAQ